MTELNKTQSQPSNLEVRGRLWLWAAALQECGRILQLYDRNESELESGRPSQREKEFYANFQAWLKEQPDYDPAVQKLSDQLEFSTTYPKEYPAFIDCIQIKSYTGMLATVLFCQIFTSGKSDEGKVAGNTKFFVQKHLDKIIESVFKTVEERKRFRNFKKTCLRARDRMIGHADGVAFEMEHGDPVSKMKMLTTAVDDIDFKYMASIVEPLRIAVLKHTNFITT